MERILNGENIREMVDGKRSLRREIYCP